MGLAIEKADDIVAVVLADNVENLRRKALLTPLLDAGLHMALDDGDREARLQVVLLVLVSLVLNEVLGIVHLSDVVVQANTRQHGIGPDRLGGLERQLGDVQRVVVGSYRRHLQPVKQWAVAEGKLVEPVLGRQVENALADGDGNAADRHRQGDVDGQDADDRHQGSKGDIPD